MGHLYSNEGIKDVDVEDTKRDLESLESAMFCAHLSLFCMLQDCYQDKDFLSVEEHTTRHWSIR